MGITNKHTHIVCTCLHMFAHHERTLVFYAWKSGIPGHLGGSRQEAIHCSVQAPRPLLSSANSKLAGAWASDQVAFGNIEVIGNQVFQVKFEKDGCFGIFQLILKVIIPTGHLSPFVKVIGNSFIEPCRSSLCHPKTGWPSAYEKRRRRLQAARRHQEEPNGR